MYIIEYVVSIPFPMLCVIVMKISCLTVIVLPHHKSVKVFNKAIDGTYHNDDGDFIMVMLS